MEASIQFIGGQLAIALGVYLLSKSLPWPTVAGIWLIVEGAIAAVYGLIAERDESKKTAWNE